MNVEQVLIPDVGEATDVEVVEVCVNPGDTVAKDECLVVLESDKASMEVPAPFDGVVKKLGVACGDKVEEGQLIVEIETRSVSADAEAKDTPAEEITLRPAQDTAVRLAQTSEYEVVVPEVGDAKDVKVVEVLVAPNDCVGA